MIQRHSSPGIWYKAALVLVPVAFGGCSSAKRPRAEAEVNVAGGTLLKTSDHPEIVEIKTDTTEAFQESCSAVLIGPRLLLTAAHCVWQQKTASHGTKATENLAKTAGRDFGGGGFDSLLEDDSYDARRKRKNPFEDDIKEAETNPGVKGVSFTPVAPDGQALPAVSSSCYVFPKGYGLEAGRAGSRFDIGLVFLSESFSASKFISLPEKSSDLVTQAIAGQKTVEMFGYGWDQKPFGDSHQLRKGTNRMVKPKDRGEDGMIYTFSDTALGEKARDNQMVRDGDSGGPLFLESKLIGIASALLRNINEEICQDDGTGSKVCEKKNVDMGYYVDLNHPKTRHFIDKMIEKFDQGEIDPKSLKGCTPRNRSEYIKWLQTHPDLL